MKLSEIIKIIETEYPPELAYEWDNSGLFYGNPDAEIKRVIVTLDVTPDVICQAIKKDAQLILAHHPFTMSGIKTLSDNSMHSDMTESIIKNNIAVYSAHTNMDTAKDGINQKLAELFDLKNIEILEKDKPYDDCGLGRVGELVSEFDLFSFCEVVKEKLNTPFVRLSGENRTVRKIAVASGSCSEYVPTAIKKGADVIITADMKYHHCIEFVYDGIAIIDAGHFPTEIIVCEMFSKLLKDSGLEIIKADIKDIFSVK